MNASSNVAASGAGEVAEISYRIVCVSHLIWEETLFQRPQQLMRCLRRRGHEVVYLSLIGARDWLRRRREGRSPELRGVTLDGLVFQTLFYAPFSGRARGLERWNDWRLARAATRWLQSCDRKGSRAPAAPTLLWLYHPGRAGLAQRIPHDRLVYDVMDHFPAFRLSQADVSTAEEQLLRRADVVFTGGHSIQRRKETIRPDAICLPSGVEVEHFARAAQKNTPTPAELRDLPHPILGYYGAVDERIDYALVDAVCRARPYWSFVIIGPLVALDRPPVSAPNFHYLGPRPYEQLPEYLKGFDIATMPWAQSELTAHLSPTKTPEYLAGGKPVVSTPIPDIERDYGDVVSFARTAGEFVAACEALLSNPPRDLAQSLRNRAAAASWDATAGRMLRAIAQCGSMPHSR